MEWYTTIYLPQDERRKSNAKHPNGIQETRNKWQRIDMEGTKRRTDRTRCYQEKSKKKQLVEPKGKIDTPHDVGNVNGHQWR